MVLTGALVALPAIASAGPTDPGGVCTVPKRLGIVFVIGDSGSMADNDPNALCGAATDIGIAQLPDGAVAAVSLKPGQSKSYSFDVQDGDRAFKALASWAGGGVSVSLTRPDGTVLAPGVERPGESFDAQPTYASVTGLDPPAGPWKLTSRRRTRTSAGCA